MGRDRGIGNGKMDLQNVVFNKKNSAIVINVNYSV
jgi:predicted membrane protein